GRPDQDGIDPTITFFEIVKIAVYGVFPCDRIVEISILDHHLRLHVTALSPLQLRTRVLSAVITNPSQLFGAPAFHVTQPWGELRRRWWSCEMVVAHYYCRVLCVSRQTQHSQCQQQRKSRFDHAHCLYLTLAKK